MLSQTYADQQNLHVGDHVKVGDKKFKVVGIAAAPLGGHLIRHLRPARASCRSSPTIRVESTSFRCGPTARIEVGSVASAIKQTFNGSQVTTAQDLAKQVSGSLVDAKNLSVKLGTALAIVALAAAFLIATPADPRLGQQAHPRDRNAQGARLAPVAGRSARSAASR